MDANAFRQFYDYHLAENRKMAHLTGWRRRTVARLQAAQRGQPEPPPPWPMHLHTDDEINAWFYESNHGRQLRAVLEQSHQVFQQLLAAIKGLPDEVVKDPERHPDKLR
jgi:hypothetical protein